MPVPYLKYTDDELFPFLNIILPAWILLALFPRSKLTYAVVHLVVSLISLLYVLLFINAFVINKGEMDFMSLQGIVKLFSSPANVFLGWVHYAAFDLWVGRWIALDAIERFPRFPQIVLLPVLFFTMMFGPSGLLAYFVIRTPFKPVKAKRD